MGTEVEETPEKLEIDKTAVELTDENGNTLEFLTVGHIEFKADGVDKEFYINAYVPEKEDGTQDTDKDVVYVVTDPHGTPVDSDDVQKDVVNLFLTEILAEDNK